MTHVGFSFVSGVNRAKIEEVTLNALRTRQSLVKGERLVRTEVRAVLHNYMGGRGSALIGKRLVGRLRPHGEAGAVLVRSALTNRRQRN